MARHIPASTALARRYVTALLSVGEEKPGLPKLRGQLEQLATMIESSADFSYVLSSPLLSVADQQRAVGAVLSAAKFCDALAGFVRVALRNRRGAELSAFIQVALDEIDRREGVSQADVTVAAPLSTAHQDQLAAILSKWTSTRVGLNVIVSSDILGGMKIRLGSVQIDDSVSGKLGRLKQVLGARTAP